MHRPQQFEVAKRTIIVAIWIAVTISIYVAIEIANTILVDVIFSFATARFPRHQETNNYRRLLGW